MTVTGVTLCTLHGFVTAALLCTVGSAGGCWLVALSGPTVSQGKAIHSVCLPTVHNPLQRHTQHLSHTLSRLALAFLNSGGLCLLFVIHTSPPPIHRHHHSITFPLSPILSRPSSPLPSTITYSHHRVGCVPPPWLYVHHLQPSTTPHRTHAQQYDTENRTQQQVPFVHSVIAPWITSHS